MSNNFKQLLKEYFEFDTEEGGYDPERTKFNTEVKPVEFDPHDRFVVLLNKDQHIAIAYSVAHIKGLCDEASVDTDDGETFEQNFYKNKKAMGCVRADLAKDGFNPQEFSFENVRSFMSASQVREAKKTWPGYDFKWKKIR